MTPMTDAERENEVRSEVLALIREEHPNPTEHECFAAEAAGQFGFEMVDDNGEWLMGRAPHFGALLDHVAKNALAAPAQPEAQADPVVARIEVLASKMDEQIANLGNLDTSDCDPEQLSLVRQKVADAGHPVTGDVAVVPSIEFLKGAEWFQAQEAQGHPEGQEERKSEGAVRHLIKRVTDCVDADVPVTKTLLQNVVTYLRQHPSLAQAEPELRFGCDFAHHTYDDPIVVQAAQPEAQELPARPCSGVAGDERTVYDFDGLAGAIDRARREHYFPTAQPVEAQGLPVPPIVCGGGPVWNAIADWSKARNRQIGAAIDTIDSAVQDYAKDYARAAIAQEREQNEANARDAAKYRALSTPEIVDFMAAVECEALHQRDRWGATGDAGKSDADWFWLIGYLAGKAMQTTAPPQKRLHHIITTAAACLNWHGARVGAYVDMRPGIAEPVATLKADSQGE